MPFISPVRYGPLLPSRQAGLAGLSRARSRGPLPVTGDAAPVDTFDRPPEALRRVSACRYCVSLWNSSPKPKHNRFHEAWALRLGTSLEDRPRYTPTTTFETFPFPDGLSPDIAAAHYAADTRAVRITDAAGRLVELRNRWLNPPEWTEWVDEPVSGYPKRPVARDEAAANELKKRTLTRLYNARPQWLVDVHAELDAAVAAAYGWPSEIQEDDALRNLLALNAARSG